MHSPEPGEKYTISVEEAIALLLKSQTFRFKSPDMPRDRCAKGTGRVKDGQIEIMIVGYQ